MIRNIVSTVFPLMKHASNIQLMSTMSQLHLHRIVWMDMEMTGLDIEKDRIMEVACIVTDGNLDIVAEGPHLILKVPKEVLGNMNEWCTKQHDKSGLTKLSLLSNVTVEDAEKELFKFISNNVIEKCCPLAGNSVYMDRLFLMKFMPKVNDYLHYRIIDVSTIKELCRMWSKNVYKSAPVKAIEHRALQDIKESIQELQFYKLHFFNL